MNRFYDAFISYGRADSKEFAQTLHDRLVQAGLKVWFDFADIPLGVDYQNQIDEGIEKADNFLYIISPHSVNSPYCAKEVELALKRNKRIIPLLQVEQIGYEIYQQRFPDKTEADWQDYKAQGKHSSFPNLHPEIAKINWVYCREGIDDFEQALQGLQAILERQRAYVQQHTVLLDQALEWERQQRRSRYLLVGEERQQAEAWLKLRFKDEQPPCVPTDLHCEFITESIKNGQNLMTQVFLSYAEEDIAVMEQIRRSLRRAGFTVWTNKTDIQTGVDFQAAIQQGVEEADNIVYLLSPAALNSVYCQQELDYAYALNKRIIPLLVQATDINQLPPFLSNLQYIDLTDNTIDFDYQADESQLLRILRQDAGYYEEHKVLLTKALKWQRQHQNPSILLRGYNLQHAEAWLKIANARSQHCSLPIQAEFIAASLQQPPGLVQDVFVSYSRADSDFARRLNDALQIQGKTTWFDQESIASGTDFQQEICRGIENSNNFLFVISPNSIRSPYCAGEVEYAQKLNKRIVTVLHRPVNPNELHPVLAAVQWIDFNQRDGDFTANFKELLRTIGTDPVYLQTHTRLLVRAIEWDSKTRKESLLLRGDDLDDAEQWLAQATNRDPKPTSLQQDYVGSSRSVEAAHRQASQILESAAKQGKQRVLMGTVVMGLGLAIASLAGVLAYKAGEETKAAESQAQAAGRQAQAAQSQAQAAKQQQQAAEQQRHLAQSQAQSAKQQAIAAQAAVTQAQARENQAQVRLTEAATATEAAEQQRQIAEQQLASATVKTAQAEQNLQQAEQKVALAQKNFTQAQIAQKEAQAGTALERQSADALKQFEFEQLDALIAAVKAGKQLQTWVSDGRSINQYPATSPLLALQTMLDTIYEKALIQEQISTDGVSYNGDESLINSARFSPSGQQIVTTTKSRIAHLWNLQGQQLAEFKGHEGDVWDASFSPDGSRVMTISIADGTARIWDLSGRLLSELRAAQTEVRQASFSPDGQRIITTCSDGTAQVWDLKARLLTQLKGEPQDFISSASFSPSGQHIVTTITSTATGTVGTQIWDLSGRSIARLSEAPEQHGFSPNGQHLVTLAKNTVQVWDFSGKLVAELKGHQDRINDVNFSPNSQWIVTASDDTTVRVWNLAGQEIAQFRGQPLPTQSAQFSPTGKYVFSTADDGIVRIWDVSQVSGTPISEIPVLAGQQPASPIALLKGSRANVRFARFSPDGQHLLAWEDKGSSAVWIWDISIKQSTPKGEVSPFSSFSPDGRRILSQSGNQVQLQDLSGKLIAQIEGNFSRIVLSTDGQRILTQLQNKVQVWDAAGRLVTEIEGVPGDNFLQSGLSADGQKILIQLQNKVQVWNAAGRLVTEISVNPRNTFFQAVFSPDSQYILLSNSTTVQKWNLAGEIVARYPEVQEFFMNTRTSPDRQRLLAVGIKTATLRDASGKSIAELKGHASEISAANFSQDGQRIVTASADKTIRVWDSSGRLIAVLQGQQPVKDVSFSADGQRVLSLDQDGTVREWRVDNLSQLLARGCSWLASYLKTAPHLSEPDRRLCDNETATVLQSLVNQNKISP
jgi:WD40 repeat protein